MAPVTQAACPRCGSKPRLAEARFCARCGLALPRAEPAPPWSSHVRPAGGVRVPPIPSTYPPSSYPPYGGAGSPVPARGRPPAPKSRSGCGCLLTILITVAAFVSVSRLSSGPRVATPPATPAGLYVTSADVDALPDRPVLPFAPPPTDGQRYGAAQLHNVAVTRSTRGSDRDDEHRSRAAVRPGGRGRVLVGVYLVEPGATGDARRGRSAVSAAVGGAWVDDVAAGHGSARYRSAEVDLSPLPSHPDPERFGGGTAQVSLFDERMRELDRVIVPLAPSRSGGSDGHPSTPRRSR